LNKYSFLTTKASVHSATNSWWYTGYSHLWTKLSGADDSDVISSYHIYAGWFSAMMWGKLCEMFVITWRHFLV